MPDGFDLSELEQFEKDLLSLATEKVPKESKKFLKKEATKLTKVNKNTYKSKGIGETGITEKEILSKFKAGKVYKYEGDLSCRAYNSHPLSHLLNDGFIHKGGKDKKGKETWIPGYKFMEDASNSFEKQYFEDTEEFIDELIEKGL